jgi:hypothetical protein
MQEWRIMLFSPQWHFNQRLRQLARELMSFRADGRPTFTPDQAIDLYGRYKARSRAIELDEAHELIFDAEEFIEEMFGPEGMPGHSPVIVASSAT